MSNPEFAAYGSKRMRWIEKDEPGEFRDANEYLRGTRLAHTTGYYCDSHCDETAVPAVFVTVSYVENGSYFAAVRDPVNDGCGIVDFEESYSDPEEAARAAHSLAERYAESAREDADKFDAQIEAQESLPEEIRYLRRAHTRAVSVDDATGARMRKEYRQRAHSYVERIRELRSQFDNFNS